MAMTRYDPFGNMLDLTQAATSWLQDGMMAPLGRTGRTTNMMPVDIYETGDAFVVKAFMPGLSPEDLSVSLEQRTVQIQGEPRAERHEGMRAIFQERPMGSFVRTFTLPVMIDPDRVHAELTNGELTLTLPKSEAAKPRKIQVNAS